MVEALDEAAHLFVDGEGHRTASGLHALLLQPGLRFIKERLGDARVVDRVQEAEESHIVLVMGEVLAINLSRDTAHALPVLVGGEHHALGVLEERVFLRIEAILDVHVERTNVARVIAVDDIDDIQEVLDVSAHRRLANLRHARLLPLAPSPVNSGGVADCDGPFTANLAACDPASYASR